MAAPKLYPDVFTCRFAPGTLKAIRAAKWRGAASADYIRTAVARQLAADALKKKEKPR